MPVKLLQEMYCKSRPIDRTTSSLLTVLATQVTLLNACDCCATSGEVSSKVFHVFGSKIYRSVRFPLSCIILFSHTCSLFIDNMRF